MGQLLIKYPYQHSIEMLLIGQISVLIDKKVRTGVMKQMVRGVDHHGVLANVRRTGHSSGACALSVLRSSGRSSFRPSPFHWYSRGPSWPLSHSNSNSPADSDRVKVSPAAPLVTLSVPWQRLIIQVVPFNQLTFHEIPNEAELGWGGGSQRTNKTDFHNHTVNK